MELEEFKSAWQTLNQKVDRQAELNLHLLRENRKEKARHGLRPLVWGQALQMAVGALLALASGSFWVDHRQVPHLLFTGLLFHAYGLAMILAGARMQVLIRRVDFGAPVVDIQKRLAQLRRFYVVGGMWIGLPWLLLWMPFTAMAIMGFFGVDMFVKEPQVITSNVAAGVVGLILALLYIRWAQGRPKLAKTLEGFAAGSSLNKAQRVLDEIARFEHE